MSGTKAPNSLKRQLTCFQVHHLATDNVENRYKLNSQLCFVTPGGPPRSLTPEGQEGNRFLYMSPDEWHQGAQLAEKAIDLFPGAPFSYWQCGKTGITKLPTMFCYSRRSPQKSHWSRRTRRESEWRKSLPLHEPRWVAPRRPTGRKGD